MKAVITGCLALILVVALSSQAHAVIVIDDFSIGLVNLDDDSDAGGKSVTQSFTSLGELDESVDRTTTASVEDLSGAEVSADSNSGFMGLTAAGILSLTVGAIGNPTTDKEFSLTYDYTDSSGDNDGFFDIQSTGEKFITIDVVEADAATNVDLTLTLLSGIATHSVTISGISETGTLAFDLSDFSANGVNLSAVDEIMFTFVGQDAYDLAIDQVILGIPEPASAMLLAGMVPFVIRRRRQTR